MEVFQTLDDMKISLSIFGAIVAAFTAGVAAADAGDSQQAPETITLQFAVDYTIPSLPDVGARDLAQVYNGEEFSIAYSFTNNEDKEIVIVGVGGAFHDLETGAIKSNLTAQPVEALTVPAGESGSFTHRISLNLVPEEYIMVPQLFIAYDNDLKLVKARGQRTEVKDVPVSIFDPQLLFLEAVLLATFGGLAYIAYNIWGVQYFKGTAPGPKPKRGAAAPASAATTDSNWLPEGHTRQKKTKKAL